MIVLGIDPGTRVTGYGVIENLGSASRVVEYGVVRTKAKDMSMRLREIFEGLQAVIVRVHPDCVAVEETFYARNVQSTIKMGEGRAVALLVGALHDLPVAEYSANLVKKSVVGVGGAHKSQVQQMVKRILGMDEIPTPEDASDALAIAICHCNRMRQPAVQQAFPNRTRRDTFRRP